MEKYFSVLVVDQSPLIRELLEAALERNLYKVFLASNLIDAEILFKKNKIDLVISGIRFDTPGSIFFILEKNKSSLPLIILSGVPETLSDTEKARCIEIFKKPASVEEILRAVEKLR